MERFDFEQKGVEAWKTVKGKWTVEDMPGAPSGKKVLVQRAVENQFNVIVAPGGPYRFPFGSSRYRAEKMRQVASSFAFPTGGTMLSARTLSKTTSGFIITTKSGTSSLQLP